MLNKKISTAVVFSKPKNIISRIYYPHNDLWSKRQIDKMAAFEKIPTLHKIFADFGLPKYDFRPELNKTARSLYGTIYRICRRK